MAAQVVMTTMPVMQTDLTHADQSSAPPVAVAKVEAVTVVTVVVVKEATATATAVAMKM